MPGLILIGALAAATLILARKAENARARRIDREPPLLERHPELLPGPIPADRPGFPGSIRYMPFDTVPEYFDDSIKCTNDDGHFFPAPEEMGIDADAVNWKFFPCACGKDYDGRYGHEGV